MNRKSALILVALILLLLLSLGCAQRLQAAKGLKNKAVLAAANTPEGKIINKLQEAFQGADKCTAADFKAKTSLLANAAAEAGLELPSDEASIQTFLQTTTACKPEYVVKVFKGKGAGVYEIRVSFNVAAGCTDESLKSFVIDNFLVIEVNTKDGKAKVTHGAFDEATLADLPQLEAALALAGPCTAPLMTASGLLENTLGEESATVDQTLPEVPEESGEMSEEEVEKELEKKVEEQPPAPQPSGPGNSQLVVERLFPGQYENTKYNLKVKDPDKLKKLSVTTVKGTSMFGGEPPCLEEVTSGTVTLQPSDFPLTGTVNDCKDPTTTYTVKADMPPLPQPPAPQPSGPGNTTMTVERLFPGQYENTKYNLKIRDPDKINRITVNKAGGGGILGGGPPCLEEVPSGTVTLLPTDFPLKATVNDCKDPGTTYTVTAEMPPVAAPPQPPTTPQQPQRLAAGCNDSDEGNQRPELVVGTCADTKGGYNDTCKAEGMNPTSITDYVCQTTFESTSADQKFCVVREYSCPGGCKAGRCLSQSENPNFCSPACDSSKKCVNRVCVYKNCDDIGGKICAAGELCTSRLVFSSESFRERTCCDGAKATPTLCSKPVVARAVEEKTGRVTKQGLWTYADWSGGPAISTRMSDATDNSFYWSNFGAEVNLSFIKSGTKIGRAGNDWSKVTVDTCLNNPEYQQGFSGIVHRDQFTVTCIKTSDNWVVKVRALATEAFEYVAWRVA